MKKSVHNESMTTYEPILVLSLLILVIIFVLTYYTAPKIINGDSQFSYWEIIIGEDGIPRFTGRIMITTTSELREALESIKKKIKKKEEKTEGD
jgi:hypothetical protein